MNTPNKLTVLRMIIALPFAGILIAAAALSGGLDYADFNTKLSLFLASGVVFIIAMLTDSLDGYLARKNKQITTFGKLFDPLADKIMTTTALIGLVVIGASPIYLALIFIVRDIIVDGARNLAAAHQIEVAASKWGKAKTLLQSLSIILIFFIAPVVPGAAFSFAAPSYEIWLLNIPLGVAAALAVISGYFYLKPLGTIIKLR